MTSIFQHRESRMTLDTFTKLIDEATRKSIIKNVMSSVRKSYIAKDDSADLKQERLDYFNNNDAADLEIELQKKLTHLIESESNFEFLTQYLPFSSRSYVSKDTYNLVSENIGSLELAHFFEYRLNEIEQSTKRDNKKRKQLINFIKAHPAADYVEQSLTVEDFQKNIAEELTQYLVVHAVNEFLINRDTERSKDLQQPLNETAFSKVKFIDTATKLNAIDEQTVYYLKDRYDAINTIKSSLPEGCKIAFEDETIADAKITHEIDGQVLPGQIKLETHSAENQQDEKIIKTQVMVEQYNSMQQMRRVLHDKQYGLDDNERIARFGERCSKPETLSLLDQYASWNLKKVLYALVNLITTGQFRWWASQQSRLNSKNDSLELNTREKVALVSESHNRLRNR